MKCGMSNLSSSTEKSEFPWDESFGDADFVARIFRLFIVIVLLGLAVSFLLALTIERDTFFAVLMALGALPVLASLQFVQRKKIRNRSRLFGGCPYGA